MPENFGNNALWDVGYSSTCHQLDASSQQLGIGVTTDFRWFHDDARYLLSKLS